MKRILMVILCMLLIAIPAMAEETGEGSLYTWGYLGTAAGAMAATLVVVQLIKTPLDRVWKIPTRVVVYCVALIIMLLAMVFTAGWTWEGAALTAINAAMVALATMGAYEMTFKKAEG